MATSIGEADGRAVSIGRIFSRAFETMGSNPVTVFGISFVFTALPSFVVNYIAQGLGYSQQNLSTGAISLFLFATIAIVSVLIEIVLTMLTQGALVRVTAAHLQGHEASFGDAAMTGLRAALPLFLLAILLGLGVMLGFMLFVVPGIILYLMWAVAAPALVEEKIGVIEAFGRSRHLTSGARWKVLGLGLIMLVIYWIFSGISGVIMVSIYGLQGLAVAMQQGVPFGFLLVSVVVSTLLTAIIATIQTSLYIELRDWKDGPATEALTEIFA
jgi:hypothetical protein